MVHLEVALVEVKVEFYLADADIELVLERGLRVIGQSHRCHDTGIGLLVERVVRTHHLVLIKIYGRAGQNTSAG